MLIGQSKVYNYFLEANKQNVLAHAYTLVGPGSSGKRTLARAVAAMLLNIEVEKLNASPDFYYVERIENPKTGQLRKDIIVDQARALREWLGNKSWQGGWQVAVVDEAELFNKESANALLKILEEPPEKSLIFLLTENEEALLSTIKSRAPVFYLNLVSVNNLVEELVKNGFDKNLASEAANYSGGRVGRAINFLANQEARAEFKTEIERWNKLQGEPLYKKLKIIDDLYGDPDDAMRGRAKLQQVLDIWLGLERERLLKKYGYKDKINELVKTTKLESKTVSQIASNINFIQQARGLLGQNVHPRLLMETVVMDY